MQITEEEINMPFKDKLKSLRAKKILRRNSSPNSSMSAAVLSQSGKTEGDTPIMKS